MIGTRLVGEAINTLGLRAGARAWEEALIQACMDGGVWIHW